MMLNPAAVKIAERVLEQCFPGFEPAGRWRWQCPMQNGSCVPLTAVLEENRLQLSAPTVVEAPGTAQLTRALEINRVLPGRVRFALSPSSSGLHLRADVALGNEVRLLEGVRRAVTGFHAAAQRLRASGKQDEATPDGDSAPVPLRKLLAESRWPFTERSAQEFSVDVQPGLGHAVRVTAGRQEVELNLELVRCEPADDLVPQALTIFLLTAAGSLPLIRPYRQENTGHLSFGFQVSLPAAFAAEEIDQALEGLSAAQRRCAREANVLLDRGVAQRYLALRDIQRLQPPTFEYEEEK